MLGLYSQAFVAQRHPHERSKTIRVQSILTCETVSGSRQSSFPEGSSDGILLAWLQIHVQGFLQAPQASWLSTDFGVSSPSSVGAILGSGLKDQINVRSAFAGLASSDTYPIGQSKTIRAQSILTCKRSQSDQDLGAECSSLDPSQLQKISILSQPFIQ